MSPLLIAAVLLLVGASVIGVLGQRRPALNVDVDRRELEKKRLAESAQNLCLNLGLLAAVSWVVEQTLSVLASW